MKNFFVLVSCITIFGVLFTACNKDTSKDVSVSDSGEYKGPELELTVNISSPEAYGIVYKSAFERISERTDGKVKFIYYYSGSLLSASDSLDGLGTGLADFSGIALTNFPDQFPYTEQVVTYPFMGFKSLYEATEIMNDVIMNNDLMLKEFEINNIQPLFFVGVWGTSIVTAKDVEIIGPESVSGMKLVTQDQTFGKYLNTIKATPIFMPPTEYYASLSNGVADGVVNGLNIVNIFGALDAAKAVHMFDNSLSTSVKAMCANKATWDSFDPSLQAIIMDEMQGDEILAHGKVFWAMSDQAHLDKVEELGIPLRNISGESMQAWKDALKPFGDEKIQKLYDKGYSEAFDVLNVWNEAIENYNSES